MNYIIKLHVLGLIMFNHWNPVSVWLADIIESLYLWNACSDVTGNRFEWQLGENNVIQDPFPDTSLY